MVDQTEISKKRIRSEPHQWDMGTDFFSSSFWFTTGGLMWTAGILCTGGLIGYRSSLEKSAKPAVTEVKKKVVLAAEISKPHPFLATPATSRPSIIAPTTVHFAARTLGIATVLCLGTLTALFTGSMFAIGVRSTADAAQKLEEAKVWGPEFRRRCLARIGIHESEAHLQSGQELREVKDLTPEEQVAALMRKHAENES